jgi:hypothetical protein
MRIPPIIQITLPAITRAESGTFQIDKNITKTINRNRRTELAPITVEVCTGPQLKPCAVAGGNAVSILQKQMRIIREIHDLIDIPSP